jgi:O-antigen/teichoic acid export membrane protein
MRRDLELRQFASNSLVSFVRFVGVTAVGILTSIIVSRGLGVEGRGLYTIAALLPATIFGLSHLGLSYSIVYEIAHSQHEGRHAEIVQSGLTLSIWLGIFGILIGALIILLGGDSLFPDTPGALLLIALLSLPFTHLRTNLRAVSRGKQDFRADGTIEFLFSLFSMILLLVVIFLLNGDVYSAMLATVTASAVSFLVAVRFLRQRLSPSMLMFTLRLRPDRIRHMLAYSFKIFAASIAGFLLLRVDVFLLNIFGNGVVAVGIYSVAVVLAQRIWNITTSIIQVTFPRIASWEGDEDRRTQFTTLVTRHTLWFSLLMAIPLGLVGERLIVLLYGEEFRPAGIALVAILPGIVLFTLAQVLGTDLAGRGKPGLGSVQAVISLAINLIANIILIPRYDFVGAALASTIAYSYHGLVMAFIFCRLHHQSWTALIVPNADDIRRFRQALSWARRKLNAGLTKS